MPSNILYFKSRLVGTKMGALAEKIRWLAGGLHRYKHPELREMHMEERRFPIVLKRLLREDSNVVDVGCHIGSFLSLAIALAPRGSHMAFEASPVKAAWLEAKFPQVKIMSRAVSDHAGVVQFQEDIKRPGYSRIGIGLGALEVQACTLDEILTDRRVDLIKLDIEGAELLALRGAERTINRNRPFLIFECGSEYSLDDLGISRRDLYVFVTEKLGYQIFSFSDFLFDKGDLTYSEFLKCGLYPFRAFNFVGLPK
jgi:FkbM family methyltransferase